jgi:hypothetical protein
MEAILGAGILLAIWVVVIWGRQLLQPKRKLRGPRAIFAAVHEAGCGTSPTCRDGGKPDISQRLPNRGETCPTRSMSSSTSRTTMET